VAFIQINYYQSSNADVVKGAKMASS